MSRLFILGNGFDIAHGYRTRYVNFREWMIEQLKGMGLTDDRLCEIPEIPFSVMEHHEDVYDRRELLKLLMWLLQYGSSIDEDWNEFESALYNLDLQSVIDENKLFIEDGFSDDFINETAMRRGDDKLFHAAQDFQMLAEALRDALLMIKNLFAEWIKSVEIGGDMIHFGWDMIFDRGKGIRPDDIFITFNYTETLEKVYGISENQVFHIHGCRVTNDELVVGHGEDRLRHFNNKYILAVDVLEEGIRNLRKDTDAVIRKNAGLWDAILESSITDIYCFGFSFSNVDLPYIRKISSLIRNNEACSWYLNAYSHEENELQIPAHLTMHSAMN